jgi:hypothetical protein
MPAMTGTNEKRSPLSRIAKWLFFFVACLATWVAAIFYLFIAGWSSCEVTGDCWRDQLAAVVIFLLLPVQVGIAAVMRSREKS